MKAFDISPFALPNCEAGEFWFEEARDIREIALRFKQRVPRQIRVYYQRGKWPGIRIEDHPDMENPARFGWLRMDDWFNPTWQEAQIRRSGKGTTLRLKVAGLKSEGLPDTPAGYDVDFRRTMGLRLEVPDWDQVREVAIHTGAMKALPLAVAGAFHTPIMQTAVQRLAAALANVPMSPPKMPVVSNVDARPHDDPERIRQLLIKQVVQPVLWEDSMRYLLDDGHDQFYEVGPGRVLRGLMRRIDRKVSFQCMMG